MTNPITFNIHPAHAITDEQVASLLCCAFEGGSGYWCRIVGYNEPTAKYPVIDRGMDDPRIYRHNDYALLPGGAVLCQEEDYDHDEDGYCIDEDGDRTPVHTLNAQSVEAGLKVMAEKYPSHFSDFLEENYDATTGDVFLQCCLLGEIVYG